MNLIKQADSSNLWDAQELIPEEYKEMIADISKIALNEPNHMTPVQIQSFVLNDMEFPTDFSRLNQCKLELGNRYFELRDLYFQHEKAQLQAQLKDEEIENEKHPIRRKMLELDKAQELLKAAGIESRVRVILAEARVFHAIFQQTRHLDQLSHEERQRLEKEFWAEKALNMPLTFEEKYGPGLLKELWGEELYSEFVKRRQSIVGFLHKEIADRAREFALKSSAHGYLKGNGDRVESALRPSKRRN